MADFPTNIEIPSSIDYSDTYRTLTAKFGDGYEQFSPDGINTKETTYTLKWTILSLSDYNTLVAYLDTQTPSVAFNWTDPNTQTVKVVRFLQDSFSASRDPNIWVNVSIKFKSAYGY